MSSYGHFALEVKTRNNGWQRVTWKSKKSLYPYLSDEEEKREGEDYIHEYILIGNYYNFRDDLRNEDFGHNGMCEDFTEETKANIKDFKENGYGWYEGYFYLNELTSFIKQKRDEIEKLKSRNMQQAIYDEVRSISAKLDNKEFKKDKEEPVPFDERYESDIEDENERLESLEHIASVMQYMADETCGWTDSCNIRVIIVAG